MVFERVGGEHAGAAAIGEDGEAAALRPQSRGERDDGLEELAQAIDAQHARAAEGGVVDGVGAGERAGMGKRGPGACGAASRLDDDHRLGARGDPPGGHEFARVRDALDVEQDRPRRRIERQIVEHVAEIDVAHVAERGDMREADVARRRPVEHGGGERPRLGDEGEVAGAPG